MLSFFGVFLNLNSSLAFEGAVCDKTYKNSSPFLSRNQHDSWKFAFVEEMARSGLKKVTRISSLYGKISIESE